MVFLPEGPTGSQPPSSESQKPIALASRTSFFRHLSIPGGYRNRFLRCHSLGYPDGVDSPSIRPSMLAIKRLVKWLSASSNQIIQGMLDQPSARRHQSLLQARQRPVPKGRREPRGGGRAVLEALSPIPSTRAVEKHMFLGHLITRLSGEWIQSDRKGLAGGF